MFDRAPVTVMVSVSGWKFAHFLVQSVLPRSAHLDPLDGHLKLRSDPDLVDLAQVRAPPLSNFAFARAVEVQKLVLVFD